jgi:hypothetical protein
MAYRKLRQAFRRDSGIREHERTPALSPAIPPVEVHPLLSFEPLGLPPPPPDSLTAHSEAARLLPPIGSHARSFCDEYERLEHQPLDFTKKPIRLIRLRHRTCTYSPLSCTMITDTTRDRFTAVSYVWGPKSSNHILVVGKRFVVRDNIYDFLFLESRHQQCETTLYWIDQLCVDQQNLCERNHQVSLMSDIVTVW